MTKLEVAAAVPLKEEPKSGGKTSEKAKDSVRDTIESVLFAFVLAFLFRTFAAEAFVIPTGSMAPTLYGRHKEGNCQACGFHIVVGASHEVMSDSSGYLLPHSRMQAAVCPNCGFENPQFHDALAFNGDRILVDKFPYEFGEPSRWDVFVFKYPTEPNMNYIKRLVGLPGETIRIRDGNLFLLSGSTEEILRKQPDKQRVLQIPVYDDDQAPHKLLAVGWPERWAAVARDDTALVDSPGTPPPAGAPENLAGWTETTGGWTADREKRTYSITTERSQQPVWLRYRHFFSTPEDWRRAEQGQPIDPQARLVGDFCGYNATLPPAEGIDFGPYWDPDLTVNFEVDIQAVSDAPELLVELCEGTAWYRCRINPSSGVATLEEVNSQLNGRVKELGSAQTVIKGPGKHSISFANVDDRLCFWIDDALIEFGPGALLDSGGATGNPFPVDADLTPVGIAAQGLSAAISHLLLERDVYYRSGRSDVVVAAELSRYVRDPQKWGEVYARRTEPREMSVGPDHFLAFGDNSPQSNDSRMWDRDFDAVPRMFLVGKAFWIYWPHGVPFLNGGRGIPITYHYVVDRNGAQQQVNDYPRYTIPFYPQFWRMTRIR